MIEFRNISVRYGTQEVIQNVNFRINKSERVGIIGPNGSGKSTLFRLILKEADPDTGDVYIEENPRIGHIRQHLKADTDDETLLEYALRGIPGLGEMEHEIHALEHQLSETQNDSDRQRLLKKIGEVQSEFEHLGGYEIEAVAGRCARSSPASSPPTRTCSSSTNRQTTSTSRLSNGCNAS
jgi:ATPase subunit of ABC transporter with duplicated ATPase domains